MEAHESIRKLVIELALDGLFVHVLRNGVVDVKQRYNVIADSFADKLTQAAVDIHFTGYRNASAGQTAVHKTGNKTELGLECRPALSGDRHILAVTFVLLNPVEQGQLVLCKLRQNLGLVVAVAKLSLHILHHFRNTGIVCMLVERFKQIKFGVLFDLHAQIVKLLDRRIAGKEVERSGAERDNL